MANHQSAIKRTRSNETKRLRNRYQLKACRASVKKLKHTTDQAQRETLLKKVASALDKLAKKNIIHSNKAANSKSKLTKWVNEGKAE